MTTFYLCLSFSRLALQLGGPGLILIGILDNSFIPTAGLLDVLTIVLAAADRDWWLYYAVMSTAGAILGGYITYRLGRTGGEAALEKRVSADKIEKIRSKVETMGWGAIVLSAILPPPFPAPPFLFAAGAFSYPVRKFLIFLGLGRAARYLLIAFLASLFGRRLIAYLRDSDLVITAMVITLVAVAGAVLTVFLLRRRRKVRNPGVESPAAGRSR